MTATAGASSKGSASPGVLLAVLGVVYGDIGTSPLYALKTALMHFSDDGVDRSEVLGVLSLAFWALLMIVTLKYVVIILRADNKGEGGILALMALAQRMARTDRLRRALTLVGIAGACLFFGDGVITPAISVLSAVEGLEIATPALHQYVIPISLAVIVALFALQSHGTADIGRVFGPVMALWFITIGALGFVQILQQPSVLAAVSPHYAAALVLREPLAGFIALGSVVLAVTGAEALYADMGHFGRRPIRLVWASFVLPSLVLNYFGQGALILGDETALASPFYLLSPGWLQLPLVILATAATVIASQAMISGAYSIARQCTQLGFAPRLVVRHTSETEEGQIYLPQVNWLLLLGVVVLVVLFRNSEALAAAYGIAVTGTFLCTSILAVVVFRRMFGWSRLSTIVVFGTFFVIDLSFFVSNVLKVPEGGWVPLALGGALYVMMTTWRRGRDLLFAKWRQDSMPLASFLARLPASRTIRVPGIAVFMTGNAEYVPTALLHNLKHNKVLHERVVFVTVRNEDIPEVGAEARMSVETLAPNIHRVTLCYGFMESPNVPRALDGLKAQGVAWEPMQASYFLGRETIVPAMVPKMSLWRHWLFLAMARNAVSATEFFRIPSDRVVELGVRIAI